MKCVYVCADKDVDVNQNQPLRNDFTPLQLPSANFFFLFAVQTADSMFYHLHRHHFDYVYIQRLLYNIRYII